jgi:hypothetical protein
MSVSEAILFLHAFWIIGSHQKLSFEKWVFQL